MIRPLLSAAALLAAPGAQALEGLDLDARAERLFSVVFAEPCDWAFNEDGSVREPPERHDFEHIPEYGEPQTLTIFRFECNMGAYNTQQVYLLDRPYEGLMPIAFAAPTFEAVFEDPEEAFTENAVLLRIDVSGMTTRHILVNSDIDPETGNIAQTSFWRGLGDASSSGVWRRDGEDHVLVRYEVDPTYDGEINPVVILDYGLPDIVPPMRPL